MSPEMRVLMNKVIGIIPSSLDWVEEDLYLDQAQKNSLYGVGEHFLSIAAAYTTFGVACIEEAFKWRMRYPMAWDSKDLIKSDIESNPHLHPKLKEGLLEEYVGINWAWWHDAYFCKRILENEIAKEVLEKELRENAYLTEASRENLLGNLANFTSGV